MKRPMNYLVDALLYDLCQESARRRGMSLAEFAREALETAVDMQADLETPPTPLRKLIAAYKAQRAQGTD